MTDLLFSGELAAIRSGYSALLAKLEAITDDHSPGAIFVRARRASWRNAPKSRAWKARAIGLNPDALHNAIALSGMAPIQVDDRWMLGIAYPQPNPVGGLFDDVEDVILIDPKANTATVMGDRSATHIAPRTDRDRLAVTADPKAWARDIALDRLEWYNLRRSRLTALKAEPTWTGDIPSALIMADPRRVRWADFCAKIIDVPAELRNDINRAMFAQARLPRIEARAS